MFKLVRKDNRGNIEIYNPVLNDWGYWFEEDRLNSETALISWIRHLSGKNWITNRHIQDLIDLYGLAK